VTFEPGSKPVEIGNWAFAGTLIRSLELPESVKRIGAGCFESCRELKQVKWGQRGKYTLICEMGSDIGEILCMPDLPDGAHTLGARWFLEVIVLRSVCIPWSVKIIGDRCFSNCWHLSEVTFERGSVLRGIGAGAFEYTALRRVQIPSSVEHIGEYSFGCCFELSAVTFESVSKLRRIEKEAFTGTALRSIQIPSSVAFIGPECFMDCEYLHEMTFESDSQLMNCYRAFDYCSQSLKVHYPADMDGRVKNMIEGALGKRKRR
jgi:hypothetical protein